jgi:hypothetical protein
VSISLSEYEEIRRESTWFFVIPGHEDESVERIVGSGDGYLIVEKVGEAAAEAEELDPRR